MGVTSKCVERMNLLLTLLIAVGPNIGSGQGVILKDEGVSQGQVSTINCSGAGVTCTRSGTTGTMTVSGGGSGSCLPAGAGDGGCLTADDQSISGVKTFLDGANFDGQGIHLTGPFGFLQQTDGRGLYLRDSLAGGSSSIDFYLQTLNTRTAGEVLRISNNASASLVLDYASVLSVNGETAHFLCNGLASGAYCLLAGSNLYLGLGGQLPARYWGHHGAVQVANVTRMTAGFPFEVYNAYSGTGLATDHIFMVGYRGSISTQSNLRSYELMVCDGTDVNPPSDPSNRYSPTPPLGCTPGFESDGGYKYDAGLPDGGVGLCYDWYVATGEGHAQEGEIVLWVDDVGEACQCDATYYDGGLTSSWRRMSDRGECSAPMPPPASSSSSPLTTKGDIYTFTTVDARKAVGADGLCLKANSAEATGLEWAACSAGGGGESPFIRLLGSL